MPVFSKHMDECLRADGGNCGGPVLEPSCAAVVDAEVTVGCGEGKRGRLQVAALCNGSETCGFRVSNANLGGDPCVGTKKQASVQRDLLTTECGLGILRVRLTRLEHTRKAALIKLGTRDVPTSFQLVQLIEMTMNW